MMNDLMLKNQIIESNIKIENMIYEIRGIQVMLDSDLAMLYECKNGTKSINLAVKRHPNRFPERFMFQLTKEEYYNILRFQSETLELKQGKYSKYLPFVFTESGVAMLAILLKTEVAEEISVRIMDAFVAMRHFIVENKDVYKSINIINNRLLEHDEKINYLFSKFDTKEQLFLEGQTYSSYRNILEILNSAKNSIIIIDEYADITFLDLIRTISCNITLITRDSNRLSNIEIEKYNKEYNNLTVVRNNNCHDRFLLIDWCEIYLLGTSINNIGKNLSMLIKLENEDVKKVIIQNTKDIINIQK